MSRILRNRERQCENSVCGHLIFHLVRQIRFLSAALRIVGSLGVNLCVNRTPERGKENGQGKEAKKSGCEESRRESLWRKDRLKGPRN